MHRGKLRRPFPPGFNPKIAARNARLHRLKSAGLLPAGDKASLRAAADMAASSHSIRKVPARATTAEDRSTDH